MVLIEVMLEWMVRYIFILLSFYFCHLIGIYYGFGVYFSIYASYSHYYASMNNAKERHMFLSRVLIGKQCLGHNLMKLPDEGCHSSTNGSDIFVTYHDAQAYPEYLIVYT